MKRQYLLFSGLALIAVVIAFFLGRADAPNPNIAIASADADAASLGKIKAPVKAVPLAVSKPPVAAVDKSSPLPPPGTPLKSIFADLQARADAGDAAAAMRLIRDLRRCSMLPTILWRNARAAEDIANRKTDGLSAPQLRTYEALLDSVEARQSDAQKTKEMCDGVDGDMLGSLVPNLAQAAQLGDTDARACYLSRGPTYDMRGMLDRPEELQSYRNQVQSMISAGLTSGDWRTIELLKNAYMPGAQGLLAGFVGADPVQYYRYLKLYRLGAESFRAAALDQQLAAAAAGIKPDQIAAADEWAKTTLQNGFNNSPSTAVTPQGWDPCAFP